MFGQIAAANALSDIYAMGGTPKTALNIVGFPIKELPDELLAGMMKGMSDKVAEAGATIVGGHSIDDNEPKLGLAATGVVHPERIFKNAGARIGDKLVLTKPIGAGVLTTALKRDKTSPEEEQQVTEMMAALNKTAAETLVDYSPSAVTDVTGFGLLGHAYEMTGSDEITLSFQSSKVPRLPGAKEHAEAGMVPGGSKANARWLESFISWEEDVDEVSKTLLTDAITSGGLLVSLPAQEAESYVNDLHEKGLIEARIIGDVVERESTPLTVY